MCRYDGMGRLDGFKTRCLERVGSSPTTDTKFLMGCNMKKKQYVISELASATELLTCPVCTKKFKPNEDTKYIAAGGYTCSWKCFLTEVKRQEENKNNKKNKK